MEVTFLGTSSGIPTRTRNVSSVALRLPQRAEVWLFDCGEATQHQLLRSAPKISQISRIFITHLHGDHVFGLPGLLATCGLAGHATGIALYGPPGLEDFVRSSVKYSYTILAYPLEIYTIEPGLIYEDEELLVSCLPLKHRVPAFGFRVAEKDRPGRFDVEQAAALGIPAGPLYGKLKRGEQVILPDGRTINGAQLCGPTEVGRKIVYCTDTIYSENAIELARDADLLIHEATYVAQDEALAHRGQHSTAQMAARVASEARVRKLIITHFSQRYARGNEIEPEALLAEARAVFPETEMARDFLTVEVPRRLENR
ncbi:MAG: ribonuclease Z [Pyrinomonadaceae bacterium]|nr:ribonuclease Z [Pyrinomonadaceae bacterium]